jgi:hypothetical protein
MFYLGWLGGEEISIKFCLIRRAAWRLQQSVGPQGRSRLMNFSGQNNSLLKLFIPCGQRVVTRPQIEQRTFDRVKQIYSKRTG